jgi:hypothetical protein
LAIILVPIGLSIAFVTYVIAVLAYAFLWIAPNDDGSSYIPANLQAKPIYRDNSGFAGPGGSCAYALYSIPASVQQRIQRLGSAFFAQMPQPEFNSKRNPYSAWRKTPAPPRIPIEKVGSMVDLSYARGFHMNGCSDDSKGREKVRALIGGDPLEASGNYYAISRNKEGLIIVVPARSLVIYAYFG